jgi:mono/diheme cytochrome c family protein
MKRFPAGRPAKNGSPNRSRQFLLGLVPCLVAATTVALLIAARSSARGPAQANSAPEGSAQNGKQIFMSKGCFACHGSEAQGTQRTRPVGVRIGPPTFSFAFFSRYVRQPTGQMPAFAPAALSDAQLADIFAFLNTVPPPPPSEVAPAGNAENGRALFVKDGCYECHGREGQGSLQTRASQIGPPPIPFSAFLAYARHPSGAMPPYTAKVVSEAEMADIYAFLKSVPLPPRPATIPLLNE